MTKDEALKLALEALEEAWYHVGTFQPTEKAIDLYDEARTAIKEALAQPEQPKVRTGNCLRVSVCASEGHKIAPQRKPLTEEEIFSCENSVPDETVTDRDWCIYFARAIEAAHGIKEEFN